MNSYVFYRRKSSTSIICRGIMVYFSDYEKVNIGGGNPYQKCAGCGMSEPHINGDINKHLEGCPEVSFFLKREKWKEDLKSVGLHLTQKDGRQYLSESEYWIEISNKKTRDVVERFLNPSKTEEKVIPDRIIIYIIEELKS